MALIRGIVYNTVVRNATLRSYITDASAARRQCFPKDANGEHFIANPEMYIEPLENIQSDLHSIQRRRALLQTMLLQNALSGGVLLGYL